MEPNLNMTLERKLLIATGALIAALIIAIGSFSLGLYVGQHDVLPGPPSVVGSGGLPAQPLQATAVPDQPRLANPSSNLPAGPPELIGPLRAVESEGLVIGTRQGPRLVHVDDDTQISNARGESVSPEELTVGAQLAVFGHLTDEGRTMVAETVVILSPSRNEPGPLQ